MFTMFTVYTRVNSEFESYIYIISCVKLYTLLDYLLMHCLIWLNYIDSYQIGQRKKQIKFKDDTINQINKGCNILSRL